MPKRFYMAKEQAPHIKKRTFARQFQADAREAMAAFELAEGVKLGPAHWAQRTLPRGSVVHVCEARPVD